MTSPDERFDDAYGDNRISRGLWQEMPQEPFVLPSSSFPPGNNIRAALRYVENTYGPKPEPKSMSTFPSSGWRSCGKGIYWWNGEYDDHCILRHDHPEGIHWDGATWFADSSDEMYVVDIEDRLDPETTMYIAMVYGPPKGLLVL